MSLPLDPEVDFDPELPLDPEVDFDPELPLDPELPPELELSIEPELPLDPELFWELLAPELPELDPRSPPPGSVPEAAQLAMSENPVKAKPKTTVQRIASSVAASENASKPPLRS